MTYEELNNLARGSIIDVTLTSDKRIPDNRRGATFRCKFVKVIQVEEGDIGFPGWRVNANSLRGSQFYSFQGRCVDKIEVQS